MQIEEAILLAIEYETRVRDVYNDAAAETNDPAGKRVFETLANEEQGHLDYLTDRLKSWRTTGKLDVPTLETILPAKDAVSAGIEKLEDSIEAPSRADELALMNKALEVETETSEWYRKTVDALDGDGKEMFRQFLEIEESHKAIVQAEIDALSGHGYFFDFSEIRLGG